ncbi:MAG TPA: DegQ family serine endoprotease [Steroidobacteraceae bacterium]|jgi:serine protease Do|nr:DegQ family serine endoprotease [Steroidobacteraceae bacterium]
MTLSRSARRAVTVFLFSFALGACAGDSRAQPAPASSQAAAGPVVPTVPVTSPALVNALPNFAPLVEKSGPAVVNVDVVESAQPAAGPGGQQDDPLNDFFRRFGIPAPDGRGGGGGGPQQPQRGSGSGFIVTSDGYILTNAHVVADADQVTVKMNDRREYPAKVVGVDQRTDVAVIKIDAKNLPTVRIGDPAKLRPGEWVLAIGSPFGFENSATAGIVSATSRSLPNEGNNYVPFIQTDVAVNPGNSGGPLFNLQGEVIGINSQIFSRTGGYMGLSFAIPIDVAMEVRDQLIKTGHVTRGRIGVSIQNVDGQLAESFGLDRPRGALVSSVVKDGPSEKAGVKPGDVILAVNEHSVELSSELPSVVARMKPGSPATLTVWRGGKEQKIDVKIDALDEPEMKTASLRGKGRGADQASQLGLAVRPLDPAERQQVETDGTLVVEQVSGPALAAGVQQGDIILAINGKKVKTIAELQAAAKTSSKTVALLIQRGDGGVFFLPLRLS